MNSIWAVGIPILLVDVANPVLLVAIAYALTRSRPIAKSYALILGHTLAYFLMGILIVYGYFFRRCIVAVSEYRSFRCRRYRVAS